MKLEDVNGEAVLATIREMQPTFHTKDLSEHPIMRDHHRSVINDYYYHARVGSYLSRLANAGKAVSLVSLSKGSPRGALWRKLVGQDR